MDIVFDMRIRLRYDTIGACEELPSTLLKNDGRSIGCNATLNENADSALRVIRLESLFIARISCGVETPL